MPPMKKSTKAVKLPPPRLKAVAAAPKAAATKAATTAAKTKPVAKANASAAPKPKARFLILISEPMCSNPDYNARHALSKNAYIEDKD